MVLNQIVVDELEIINELENRFQHCYTKEQILLNDQKLKQNDAKVTFYKYYAMLYILSIHLLILTNRFAKYDEDMKFWMDIELEAIRTC